MNPENIFRAMADQTRLRMLVLLCNQGELCVCELTHALNASQPKISRHLALLREAGIVQDRRQGKWVYYRLSPSMPDWAQAVIEQTTAGLIKQPPGSRDLQALKHMPGRPAGEVCCA